MRRLLLLAPLLLAACGDKADLPVTAGQGADPQLPAPKSMLLPTVKVADVTGWPAGSAPVPAAGLKVAAFATGLDHPRWLYTLPNGDVLVAETTSPPQPKDEEGLKGMAAKVVMSMAGARGTSANRISILRDTNGDGVADLKQPFITGLNAPIGMVLVGNDLYVAETDKLTRFAYVPGATSITTPGVKLADLPGGARNHHWTKTVVASPMAARCMWRWAAIPTSAKTGWTRRRTAPASSPSTGRRGRRGCSPPGCATPSAWPSSR